MEYTNNKRFKTTWDRLRYETDDNFTEILEHIIDHLKEQTIINLKELQEAMNIPIYKNIKREITDIIQTPKNATIENLTEKYTYLIEEDIYIAKLTKEIPPLDNIHKYYEWRIMAQRLMKTKTEYTKIDGKIFYYIKGE